jgi:isopenicillin N synthase-like dioxygenase
MNIPVLDLSLFTQGNKADKANFVSTLGTSFESIGFVSIKNHGMVEKVINDLYLGVEQFFSLPTEIKKKYEIENLAGQRGYTSFGKEHAKGSSNADLKEFFQYGQPSTSEELSDLTHTNVQVVENQLFNSSLLESFFKFEEIGISILQAISIYLGLSPNYFDNYVVNGNSIIRAIHYPPITSEPNSSIRAEQHEDINLITLLVGASSEGLQILDKSNVWLPINASKGEIVVNVGDMLQRLTNNKLKSTTHRVVNPSREKWNSSRYSIPFFLHPVSSMSLACLPSCISEYNPSNYIDYTAGEYLDERLREIGLKK